MVRVRPRPLVPVPLRGLLCGLTCGLACALALVGCGGSATHSPSPSNSPSASPSAVRSPAIPPMPSAAKAHSKAGAVAFARHYVDLINYAQATGDVKALRAVEAAGCESCTRVRHELERIYGAGGWIKGGAWRIADVADALPNTDTDGFNVDIVIKTTRQRVKSSREGSVNTVSGGANAITVFVSPSHGIAWKVSEWTRAK
ncbi:DUF6318 family protein [Nocardioides terrisoli]|uniref:DUF6318 family protein n=1 Tax=Nocardioides terrisoli TaxID=3388267 RepID=UPI00287B93AD|nr:DUF6318 family protein [Nocardioides marmorisolisilvae]